MAMMIIMTGAILPRVDEASATDENYFKNTEFNISSGLFHEKLGTLRIIGGTRKISIVLTKLKNDECLQTFVELLDKALSNCQKAGQLRCRERINYARLKKQIDLAKDLRTRLLQELNEINHKPTDFSQTRKKRQAEINVDTLRDSLEFDPNLYADDSISILMDNQNYTIRSELDELNQLEPTIIRELSILQNELKNPTLNFTQDLEEYVIYENFNLILENSSLKIEKSIEEYMKYLEVMLAVIHSIQQGKVHPYLIKRKQLIAYISKIKDLRGNLQFPFRINKLMNVLQILQISSLSYKMVKDDLHVILHIPLIDKMKFNFYQVHSIYVSKSLVNNTLGVGYIQPKTKFFAIDIEAMYYFTHDENLLKKCHKIDGIYICQLIQAYYSVSEMNICEVKLMNSVSEEILRTCDIRVSMKGTPLWTAIASLGGWLYSLTVEERGIISCDDQIYTREIILKNSGILQLRTGCQLRTKTITLPSLAYRRIDFHHNNLVVKNQMNIRENDANFKSGRGPIIYCAGSMYDCHYSNPENLPSIRGSFAKNETNPLIFIILICIVTVLINLSILFCKIRLCRGEENKKVNVKTENKPRQRVTTEYLPTKMSKSETYI